MNDEEALIIDTTDDGGRNALNEFMMERDKNIRNMFIVLLKNQEFWKARVFLEMVWTIEKIRPHSVESKNKDLQ